MDILFFASTECSYCERLLNQLKKIGLLCGHDFIYIDALADDAQDFCDDHHIDELPHIKIYDKEKLIFNCCGEITTEDIEKILKS